MAQGTPAHRVPQGVEAATQLIKGRDTLDIILLILTPIGLMTTVYMTGLFSLTQFAGSVGVVFAINYVLFSLIPTEESVAYWIKSYANYKQSSNVILKDQISPESIDTDVTVDTDNTGGRDITETDPEDVVSVDESSQSFSRVEEIDTYNGVIKLTTGEFISAVRVVGMERNLINENVKAKATQSFQNFARTTDFDIGIKCTSNQFPIDSEVQRYTERLQDEDVNQKPILRRVIQSKKQFVNQRIRGLGMNNRQFYIVIRVEASDQSIDEGGPFNLDFIAPDSAIGNFLSNKFGDSEEGKTKDENLTDIATNRRKAVRSNISQIKQCSASEINGEELARITRNFFAKDNNGEQIDGWERSQPVTVTDETLSEAEAQ